MNIKKNWLTATFLFFAFAVSGCGSIPGETPSEQEETIDLLVERTLADLYKQDPNLEEEIKNSPSMYIQKLQLTERRRKFQSSKCVRETNFNKFGHFSSTSHMQGVRHCYLGLISLPSTASEASLDLHRSFAAVVNLIERKSMLYELSA